ncbi:MAG: TatD family hydrolase, partial [Acidobacteriota bacterium]
ALDAAREAGVRGFLVPSIRLDEDAELLLELCHQNDDVWCALGTHPHHAATWRDGDVERLRGLAAEPKVVAIGECGLDYHYDFAPRDVQERVMREQWQLALELGLPVVIHNRDSNERMTEIFLEDGFRDLAADFHSFAGGYDMAKAVLDRGAYLGMSGMVTFKRADNVREVLPITPKDRVMVETDTPFLAPVPHRGKPNRPGYVPYIVERLAREMGESTAEMVRLSRENFFRLFSKAAA